MKIGVDLVQISRMEQWCNRAAILKKVYSDDEQRLFAQHSGRRKLELMAGRFAVKEAVIKALGIVRLNLAEIETLQGSEGAPVLRLKGEVLSMAQTMGLVEYCVSVSHEAGLAIACVVLEKEELQ